jgi:cytochrome c biogenesis protein CcmG, thiol:disulfide interchange protein DsbE
VNEVLLNGKNHRGRGRLVLGMAILLITSVMTTMRADAALRIGDVLPRATLVGMDGAQVTIPEMLRGKVLLLHFWQIGCSSCREEMPTLDGMYAQYRSKGLEILAVNVAQRKDTVKAFAAELKVSYPILLDTEAKVAALYEVTNVPRTYLIDRSGIIRQRVIGTATAEMLRKLIRSLL